MRITATSYCHVPRSYDQKNVFERTRPRLAISVRGHAVDDDTVAHVHHAIEVSGRFRVVRDHHHGLAELLEATTYFDRVVQDRKSTRLNSSHVAISYAVFCLKKKNITK